MSYWLKLGQTLVHSVDSLLVVHYIPQPVTGEDHKTVLSGELRTGDVGNVADYVVRECWHFEHLITQSSRHRQHAVDSLVKYLATCFNDSLCLQRVSCFVVGHRRQTRRTATTRHHCAAVPKMGCINDAHWPLVLQKTNTRRAARDHDVSLDHILVPM